MTHQNIDHAELQRFATDAFQSAGLPAAHAALHSFSYAGAIGFEYVPSGPNHLDWLPQWGQMFGDA